MLGMRLVRAPLHEEAVADPAPYAGHEHATGMANPATIIVVRNVQTLMQTVFDAAETGAIKLQPLLGIEFCRLGTGNEANIFILAALGLAEQPGRLCGQRKANLLRADRLGADRAAHIAALLLVLEGAILRGRRLPRGKNPPWGRGAVSRCFGEASAGCL